jgi:cysteine synthase
VKPNELGANAIVATAFADSNKKYQSTNLVKDELTKEDYLSSEIELLA